MAGPTAHGRIRAGLPPGQSVPGLHLQEILVAYCPVLAAPVQRAKYAFGPARVSPKARLAHWHRAAAARFVLVARLREDRAAPGAH